MANGQIDSKVSLEFMNYMKSYLKKHYKTYEARLHTQKLNQATTKAQLLDLCIVILFFGDNGFRRASASNEFQYFIGGFPFYIFLSLVKRGGGCLFNRAAGSPQIVLYVCAIYIYI